MGGLAIYPLRSFFLIVSGDCLTTSVSDGCEVIICSYEYLELPVVWHIIGYHYR